jgi:Fic family protein
MESFKKTKFILIIMDIARHKEEFDKIIEKYDLSDDKKAEQISNYLTKNPKGTISVEDFANIFDMEEDEVITFLSFIQKGLKFKEKHIDME